MGDFREKRQYFRVDMLSDIRASAKIFSINDRLVEVEKNFPIKILDLSASGMRALMEIDVPVNIVVLNTIFEFETEVFHFNAQIIRKAPINNGYEYGMKFIYNSSRDESLITRCLNQYKIKYTRFKKVELDLRKQKYIGCFVKVLELINEPAYLINSQRILLSMNTAAREKGVQLGERCYLTVGKLHKICPHCQIDEAMKADRIVENEATYLGKRCTARWLYLEDGLILHYYLN